MATAHSSASTTATPKQRRNNPTKRAGATVAKPTAAVGCFDRLDDRTRRAVAKAARLLEECAVYRADVMASPTAAGTYLKLKLAGLEHEEFHVIWLDAQNRAISFDRMFSGTLTQTSVYPREVVKAALAHNAAACILAHNHPSGVSGPSTDDEQLTMQLKRALSTVDVKILDHFIVAGNGTPFSFAERGLL